MNQNELTLVNISQNAHVQKDIRIDFFLFVQIYFFLDSGLTQECNKTNGSSFWCSNNFWQISDCLRPNIINFLVK